MIDSTYITCTLTLLDPEELSPPNAGKLLEFRCKQSAGFWAFLVIVTFGPLELLLPPMKEVLLSALRTAFNFPVIVTLEVLVGNPIRKIILCCFIQHNFVKLNISNRILYLATLIKNHNMLCMHTLTRLIVICLPMKIL